MKEENKLNEIEKRILEVRDYLYNQAREDTDKDDIETLDHLEREYNDCDTKKLCDDILDVLLDSFGS